MNNNSPTKQPFTVYDSPFGSMQVFDKDAEISTTAIRKAVMDGKRMKILPYEEWMQFSWAEIRMLLHQTGTYTVPTLELIDYLDDLIGEEKAIEICAGNGYIGRELGIVITDSKQQATDKMTMQTYKLMKQPLIQYPKDVIKLEASDAVRRIKPHTVLGCFATHKYREDTNSGNYKGVDFIDIYSRVQRIILVGHKVIHKDNPLMKFKHVEMMLPGLLTRAADQSLNRIFIWDKDGK